MSLLADQASIARAEEEISKRKATQLYDTGDIREEEIVTCVGLASIHAYLFGEHTRPRVLSLAPSPKTDVSGHSTRFSTRASKTTREGAYAPQNFDLRHIRPNAFHETLGSCVQRRTTNL